MRKGRFAVVAGTGAAAAYFLDPAQGRSRRARAKDQLTSKLRRRRQDADREAQHVQNVAAGQAARAHGAGEPRPMDDVDVLHAVKQALSGLEVATQDVTVEVVEGVATLRGQVATEEEKSEVEQAAGRAAGVREVQSWLHLPGQPAPNKASALQAS